MRAYIRDLSGRLKGIDVENRMRFVGPERATYSLRSSESA